MKRFYLRFSMLAMLAVCCTLNAKGEEAAMPREFLLVESTLPAAASLPRYEDYVQADGSFDEEAFSAAMEAAEALQALYPAQTQEGLEAQYRFLRRAAPVILASNQGENQLYAPSCLYMSLGLLAELTNGESRAEILELLDVEDMQLLRQQLRSLWFSSYADDGVSKSRMGSSLWFDQRIQPQLSALKALAEAYYTESYQGPAGAPEFNQALNQWLVSQTGGLLGSSDEGALLSGQTALALVSTIYMSAPWYDAFLAENTQTDAFYGPAGVLETAFMNKGENGVLCKGDRFSAITLMLKNDAQMRFVLPQEGVTPEELLHDAQLLEYLCTPQDGDWTKKVYGKINLSLPKFDISSNLQLEEALKKLGLHSVFSPEQADFTSVVSENGNLFLSSILHAARIKADEDGVEAAAYTMMIMAPGMALPEEEIDFVLNRPFLFEVLNSDGTPLFIGIINHP